MALKLLAAVLPVLVGHWPARVRWRRALRIAVRAEAAILIVYGLVLTTVGLLVQAGAIRPSAHADHRALAWHAYLWDPWFLVWGLLVALALGGRRAHRGGPSADGIVADPSVTWSAGRVRRARPAPVISAPRSPL